jgi:hypothetical protein
MALPLLRQALSDRRVRIVPRAIDTDWYYERIAPVGVAGFNPYQRAIYVGATSALSRWMAHGCRDDRRFNAGDALAKEALFLIHDYLHCWACMVIQEEMPALELGHGEITPATVESFAFCHLLTEAAATVGLDYWLLATIEVDALCGIGTCYGPLTVRYHEKYLDEFRRFHPRFVAQTPDFLATIARFYCTGEFPGFDRHDVLSSSRLKAWLEHELRYGEKQREYCREWLSYLSNGRVRFAQSALGRPVEADARWQRRLIRVVSERLWELVKHGVTRPPRRLPALSRVWRAGRQGPRDYRFFNLTTLRAISTDDVADLTPAQFGCFFSQYVSSFVFSSYPEDLVPVLRLVREKRDAASLLALFERLGVRRVPRQPGREPRDLFFLN